MPKFFLGQNVILGQKIVGKQIKFSKKKIMPNLYLPFLTKFDYLNILGL